VRRWKRAGSFPERAGVIRQSSLDRFAVFLKQRYDQGCHNAAQLWCELHQQGFHGSKGIEPRKVIAAIHDVSVGNRDVIYRPTRRGLVRKRYDGSVRD
jgi:hypothetical protein